MVEVLAALLGAIALFDFLISFKQKKFTWKRTILLLLLFIVCLFIYFKDDSQNKDEAASVGGQTQSNTIDNTISNNSPPQEDTIPNTPPDDKYIESSDKLSDDNSEDNAEIGKVFVVSTPDDIATVTNLFKWDTENDRDIIGNTYPAALKLQVYNMFDALDGRGSSDITAEIHIPFGEKAEDTWEFGFVVAQEMAGNGSSANITILADDEILYQDITITSTTTEDLRYIIDLTNVRDLVLRFECATVGDGLYVGIVMDDTINQ